MNATLVGGLILVGLLGLSRYQVVSLKKDIAEEKTKISAAVAKAAEEYRVKEQALVTFATRTADELRQAREQIATAAASAAGRLRERAALSGAAPETQASAAACRALGVPAVGVLPERTREDLVEFAKRAEVIRKQLLACQQQLAADRRIVNAD